MESVYIHPSFLAPLFVHCNMWIELSLLNVIGGKHPFWCIMWKLQSLREMDKTQQ